MKIVVDMIWYSDSEEPNAEAVEIEKASHEHLGWKKQ
jgi:hypothetical protein